MAAPNTIVLPEDTASANQELDNLLVDPAAAVYLFIFGDSNAVTSFAAAADGAADGALRKVVRRNSYADILNRFTALQSNPGLPSLTAPDLVGFSVSGHLVVTDVIRSGDQLDAMRAGDAFLRGEVG